MTTNTLPAGVSAGVGELLESWRTAWLTLDKTLMVSLFDADVPGFAYQAEEAPDVITDAAGLQAYWEAGVEVLASIPAWDIASLSAAAVDDVVAIHAVIYTELVVNGLSGTIKGDMRVSIVVHKAGDTWKIIHYHEGRQVDPAAHVA